LSNSYKKQRLDSRTKKYTNFPFREQLKNPVPFPIKNRVNQQKLPTHPSIMLNNDPEKAIYLPENIIRGTLAIALCTAYSLSISNYSAAHLHKQTIFSAFKVASGSHP